MSRYRGFWNEDFSRYPASVPVATRKKKAASQVAALQKKGQKVSPVILEGSRIATTFWGKAWCDNLERYSDFSSRLPRGRSYVRNGCVVDLQIESGKVTARVQGTSLYRVSIDVQKVGDMHWKAIVEQCAGKIDSVIELLSGSLSTHVMEVMTRPNDGLFPTPSHIEMRCSCPDWATMCKHVAAVLYGVGARLDKEPALLFRLRGARTEDLIAQVVSKESLGTRKRKIKEKVLEGADLSSVFGIDVLGEEAPAPQAAPKKAGAAPKKAGAAPKKAGAAPKKAGAAPKKSGAAPKKAGVKRAERW